jgi:hypothetical protein
VIGIVTLPGAAVALAASADVRNRVPLLAGRGTAGERA